MKDYNTIKADGFAEIIGELDDYYSEVERISDSISQEIPAWAWAIDAVACDKILVAEAKRRIKGMMIEGSEP